jgi:hypothetical protein
MSQRRTSRSFRIALALSVLLHLALLVWLWRVQSVPPAIAQRPAPIEVEISETTVTAPAAPSSQTPAPIPPQTPAAKTTAHVRAHSGTTATGSKAIATSLPSTAPASDSPLRQQPSGISLAPSATLLGIPPLVASGEGPSAQSAAQRLVQSLVVEHRRLRQPPNGYFSELRLALETLWQLEALIDAHRSLVPEGDRARVRLVQAADGAVQEVAFVVPPRSGELGRALLADLQTGSTPLPRPPPEVLHGRTQVASLWEFMVKPAPATVKLSFDFDLVSLVDKHAIPKWTRKRVEFLAREDE